MRVRLKLVSKGLVRERVRLTIDMAQDQSLDRPAAPGTAGITHVIPFRSSFPRKKGRSGNHTPWYPDGGAPSSASWGSSPDHPSHPSSARRRAGLCGRLVASTRRRTGPDRGKEGLSVSPHNSYCMVNKKKSQRQQIFGYTHFVSPPPPVFFKNVIKLH
jgi:hypothetical protein